MTREERIARHKQMIVEFNEEIHWLEASKFELLPYRGDSGASTEELIARQRKNIEMYERFIARLEGREE